MNKPKTVHKLKEQNNQRKIINHKSNNSKKAKISVDQNSEGIKIESIECCRREQRPYRNLVNSKIQKKVR